MKNLIKFIIGVKSILTFIMCLPFQANSSVDCNPDSPCLLSATDNIEGNLDLISLDKIVVFGQNCLSKILPSMTSFKLKAIEANNLEDQISNTSGMTDPRLFYFGNKWIIKIVKSRGLEEIERAAKLKTNIDVDSSLHIYIPLLFAIIRNGKWGAVKDITEYADGDIRKDDIVVEFMEKAKGKQLANIWSSLKPSNAISLFNQFGKCMRHLHDQGISHGDLHWRNVIVSENLTNWKISFIDFEQWHKFSEYNEDCIKTVSYLLSLNQFKGSNDHITQYIAAFLKGYYAESHDKLICIGYEKSGLRLANDAYTDRFLIKKKINQFDIKEFSKRYCAAFKEIMPFMERDDRLNPDDQSEDNRRYFFPILYDKNAPYPEGDRAQYPERKLLEFLVVSICNLSDEEIILIHRWLKIEWLPCYCNLLRNPKTGQKYARRVNAAVHPELQTLIMENEAENEQNLPKSEK